MMLIEWVNDVLCYFIISYLLNYSIRVCNYSILFSAGNTVFIEFKTIGNGNWSSLVISPD